MADIFQLIADGKVEENIKNGDLKREEIYTFVGKVYREQLVDQKEDMEANAEAAVFSLLTVENYMKNSQQKLEGIALKNFIAEIYYNLCLTDERGKNSIVDKIETRNNAFKDYKNLFIQYTQDNDNQQRAIIEAMETFGRLDIHKAVSKKYKIENEDNKKVNTDQVLENAAKEVAEQEIPQLIRKDTVMGVINAMGHPQNKYALSHPEQMKIFFSCLEGSYSDINELNLPLLYTVCSYRLLHAEEEFEFEVKNADFDDPGNPSTKKMAMAIKKYADDPIFKLAIELGGDYRGDLGLKYRKAEHLLEHINMGRRQRELPAEETPGKRPGPHRVNGKAPMRKVDPVWLVARDTLWISTCACKHNEWSHHDSKEMKAIKVALDKLIDNAEKNRGRAQKADLLDLQTACSGYTDPSNHKMEKGNRWIAVQRLKRLAETELTKIDLGRRRPMQQPKAMPPKFGTPNADPFKTVKQCFTPAEKTAKLPPHGSTEEKKRIDKDSELFD